MFLHGLPWLVCMAHCTMCNASVLKAVHEERFWPCSSELVAVSEYQTRLSAGINASLARTKDYDADMREGLRQELIQNAELLDQAARLAMAAMLQVGWQRSADYLHGLQR